jgi:alpha-tubulin suppressor-like RCC1 family protein
MKDPMNPFMVDSLYGKFVTDIDCGDHHSIALDGNGKIYTWGGGGSKFNKGQCGHGDFQDVEAPKQVQFFEKTKISKISAGGFHSLAYTVSG